VRVAREPFEPIEIVGVDTEHVGSPRNDGSRGSALYRVPIKLSGQPPSEWATAFPHAWDRPPRFTTMHRPGIASVSGDTVVLDGTTIEEVRNYHARTLSLVVAELNRAQVEHDARAAAEAKRVADERASHEANVRDVGADIKFE
jgi:hypothetical protein